VLLAAGTVLVYQGLIAVLTAAAPTSTSVISGMRMMAIARRDAHLVARACALAVMPVRGRVLGLTAS
jgi:hypothetical protein